MLPLSPDDIAKAAAPIPDFVIAAVNRCLTRQCRGGRAVLQQAEVIREILEANPEVTRSDLFDKRWLDFEPAFRAAGWDVEYDRPSYCETYEPAWRFSTAKAGAP